VEAIEIFIYPKVIIRCFKCEKENFMKKTKKLAYFIALATLLLAYSNFWVCSASSSDEEKYIEVYGSPKSKVRYGSGNRPNKIDIEFKKDEKKHTYSLTTEEVNEVIRAAGKTRKKKEKKAQNESPLLPTDTISFTSNINGKQKTVDAEIYQIENKEDKRKFRAVAQKHYDKSIASRKNGTPRPAPIFVQRGPDPITDISVLRAGLDVGLSPLEIRENIAGYAATKPPCYGNEVDETCDAFQQALKIIEGTRSNSSTVLRHLAEEDEDFIGHNKGGAKKLRNFDDDIVTKKDQEIVMTSFANVFGKKVEERKIHHKNDFPSKKTILNEIAKELGTETDSPSFYK
jgi:hypothetical protein